jgi:hypothetical protein
VGRAVPGGRGVFHFPQLKRKFFRR